MSYAEWHAKILEFRRAHNVLAIIQLMRAYPNYSLLETV